MQAGMITLNGGMQFGKTPTLRILLTSARICPNESIRVDLLGFSTGEKSAISPLFEEHSRHDPQLVLPSTNLPRSRRDSGTPPIDWLIHAELALVTLLLNQTVPNTPDILC